MKPKRTLPENLFTGTWKIISREVYNVREDWLPAETYGDDGFLWIFFSKSRIIKFSPTECDYEGRLLERVEGRKDIVTAYHYDPTGRLLYVKRYDDAGDGVTKRQYWEIYGIESISPGALRLYDLRSVVGEPEDYKFRLNIIRLL